MEKSELSGLSFIRRLRLHDTRTPVLVFTMHSDPTIVSRTLRIGATGYVLKDDRYDEVFRAFECVRDGKTYMSSELCSEDGSIKERETTDPLKPLTVRELQTLELLAEGKPYRAIAQHLHVSCATVSITCTQLKAKLGVYTLPELMRITIQYLPSVRPSASKEWL
jgi:two-component system invasion response regulator UvrY